ncbi:hypothetical protein OCU04_004136 [Sclerotinia nivalis]|uniref:Uncharacterized protein n=1 Tax=Sclerotinia nivalis TaxID=352851 RepID=A0A9X0APU5_9HELO|nr:hypothetical protein OCU04_004136 [Sclerotinia nivalis]
MSHDPSLQDQIEATLADPWFNRYRNLRVNHPKPKRSLNIADQISQGIENMNFQAQESDGNESSSGSRITGDGQGSRTTQTSHRDSNRERSKGARETRPALRRQGSELFLETKSIILEYMEGK